MKATDTEFLRALADHIEQNGTRPEGDPRVNAILVYVSDATPARLRSIAARLPAASTPMLPNQARRAHQDARDVG